MLEYKYCMKYVSICGRSVVSDRRVILKIVRSCGEILPTDMLVAIFRLLPVLLRRLGLSMDSRYGVHYYFR